MPKKGGVGGWLFEGDACFPILYSVFKNTCQFNTNSNKIFACVFTLSPTYRFSINRQLQGLLIIEGNQCFYCF